MVNDLLDLFQIQKGKFSPRYLDFNLMDKNRKALMRKIFQTEDVIYANRDSYYFPSIRIKMTDPKFWKRSGKVSFMKHEYIMNRLDFDDWEELDELDF